MNDITIKEIELRVSERIKRKRICMQLTQKDLGRALNVSAKQVNRFEETLTPISSSNLYVFSKVLKVPINYFFDSDLKNNSHEDYLFEFTEKAHLTLAENESCAYSWSFSNNKTPQAELSSLIKAFDEVPNPKTRSILIELIQSIASVSRQN